VRRGADGALEAGVTDFVADHPDLETGVGPWPELRCHNLAMVITRKIRKVGNSLMIPLPPETISESGFKAGMVVAIRSRPGHVDLDPASVPDKRVVDFTARFTERYREDLAELGDL